MSQLDTWQSTMWLEEDASCQYQMRLSEKGTVGVQLTHGIGEDPIRKGNELARVNT